MKRRLIEISKKISVSLLMVALTTTSLPINAIADEVIVDVEQSEETTDDAVVEVVTEVIEEDAVEAEVIEEAAAPAEEEEAEAVAEDAATLETADEEAPLEDAEDLSRPSEINLGDTVINAETDSDGDGYSYDYDTNTLTLDNCHIDTYYRGRVDMNDGDGGAWAACALYAIGDLNLKIENTLSIEEPAEDIDESVDTYCSICVTGTLKIDGVADSNPGIVSYREDKYVIYAENVEIDGVDISLGQDLRDADADADIEIRTDYDLTLKNIDISDDYICLFGNNITFDNAKCMKIEDILDRNTFDDIGTNVECKNGSFMGFIDTSWSVFDKLTVDNSKVLFGGSAVIPELILGSSSEVRCNDELDIVKVSVDGDSVLWSNDVVVDPEGKIEVKKGRLEFFYSAGDYDVKRIESVEKVFGPDYGILVFSKDHLVIDKLEKKAEEEAKEKERNPKYGKAEKHNSDNNTTLAAIPKKGKVTAVEYGNADDDICLNVEYNNGKVKDIKMSTFNKKGDVVTVNAGTKLSIVVGPDKFQALNKYDKAVQTFGIIYDTNGKSSKDGAVYNDATRPLLKTASASISKTGVLKINKLKKRLSDKSSIKVMYQAQPADTAKVETYEITVNISYPDYAKDKVKETNKKNSNYSGATVLTVDNAAWLDGQEVNGMVYSESLGYFENVNPKTGKRTPAAWKLPVMGKDGNLKKGTGNLKAADWEPIHLKLNNSAMNACRWTVNGVEVAGNKDVNIDNKKSGTMAVVKLSDDRSELIVKPVAGTAGNLKVTTEILGVKYNTTLKLDNKAKAKFTFKNGNVIFAGK